MELMEQLSAYRPCNAQEAADRQLILRCLESMPLVFTRESTAAHMTASAWVVNRAHTKVLLAWHNLYRSWAWLGGHADGERDLLAVARREVLEESGVRAVCGGPQGIFSLEVLTVDGHIRHGAYVSSHLHLNVTYLLEADESAPLSVRESENSGVAWFALDDALRASSEPWFVQHIYSKLNEKLRCLPHSV